MCGGGGDGGAAAADAAEQERQAKVAATIEAIQRAFAGGGTRTIQQPVTVTEPVFRDPSVGEWGVAERRGLPTPGPVQTGTRQRVVQQAVTVPDPSVPTRQQQIDSYRDDVLAINQREVGEQRDDMARQLRFALARSGLAGGSQDAYEGGEIKERFDRGLLRAGEVADDAAAGVRAEDEATKQRLIQMAQSGVSQGTAVQNALQSMRVNLDQSRANTQLARVGDVFADIAARYGADQAAIGGNRARSAFQPQKPGITPTSPSRSYSGTTTSIG